MFFQAEQVTVWIGLYFIYMLAFKIILVNGKQLIWVESICSLCWCFFCCCCCYCLKRFLPYDLVWSVLCNVLFFLCVVVCFVSCIFSIIILLFRCICFSLSLCSCLTWFSCLLSAEHPCDGQVLHPSSHQENVGAAGPGRWGKCVGASYMLRGKRCATVWVVLLLWGFTIDPHHSKCVSEQTDLLNTDL